MTKEITNAEDVIDSRDVIARLEELEEARKPWRAGWNMPGYMPDSEPAGFQTFEEARDYIAEEMSRAADGTEEGDEEGDELSEASKRWTAIEEEAEQGETVGQYHYWIAKVDGADAFDDADEHTEWMALKALAEEASGYAADWEHGETLVRDSYFETYAQELAEDCGMVNDNATWPNNCIDWARAARELRMDYISVDFDGVTYWIR